MNSICYGYAITVEALRTNKNDNSGRARWMRFREGQWPEAPGQQCQGSWGACNTEPKNQSHTVRVWSRGQAMAQWDFSSEQKPSLGLGRLQ
jgi:hypothetical protein